MSSIDKTNDLIKNKLLSVEGIDSTNLFKGVIEKQQDFYCIYSHIRSEAPTDYNGYAIDYWFYFLINVWEKRPCTKVVDIVDNINSVLCKIELIDEFGNMAYRCYREDLITEIIFDGVDYWENRQMIYKLRVPV